MYKYPENLRGNAKLSLWNLKDLVILLIASIISLICLAIIENPIGFVFVGTYGFLSIRLTDESILDYMTYAFNFLIGKEQLYFWSLKNGMR